MNDEIFKTIRILKNGGIVIFPTDTAFGIGCRIDDKRAVDRLFALRNRPRTQPMPVLVASFAMALPYLATPSDVVRHLTKLYWPGALTIVTTCKENIIYSPIRGGTATIGIRMPDHAEILTVIAQIGVPILGSSANFHGKRTPFTLDELDPDLVRRVDYVLPGVCKRKSVSTVVDCTKNPYSIIRQGAVRL